MYTYQHGIKLFYNPFTCGLRAAENCAGVCQCAAIEACAAGCESPQAFESLCVEEMSVQNTFEYISTLCYLQFVSEEIACCLFCYDTEDTNGLQREQNWPVS